MVNTRGVAFLAEKVKAQHFITEIGRIDGGEFDPKLRPGNLSNDGLFLDQGSIIIVQVKFNDHFVSDIDRTFETQADFQAGSGDVSNGHDALVHNVLGSKM